MAFISLPVALTNYSTEALRRVDWKFGIYGDDVENFKKAINDFIAEDSQNFKDLCFSGLSELADILLISC
jgi:small conductance mechanosensitive channel